MHHDVQPFGSGRAWTLNRTLSSPAIMNEQRQSNQRKAIIKNTDMNEKMQQEAVDIASTALSQYNIEKDVAAYKMEFDRKHSPTWHVIVGRSFGSYVSHESKHFIYFYLGQVAVLIFKS